MKHLGLSHQHFLIGTIYSLLSIVLVKGSNLIRTVIVVRQINPSEFGLFSLLITFYFFAYYISSFGFPAASTKFISQHNENIHKQEEIISIIWIFTFFTSLLGAIFIYTNANFLANNLYKAPGLLTPITIISFAVFFQSLFFLGTGCLQGYSELKAKSYIEITDAIIGLILMAVLTKTEGLNGSAFALLVNSLISCVIVIFVLAKKFRFKILYSLELNYREIKPLINFIIPTLLTGGVMLSFNWMGDVYFNFITDKVEQMGWIYAARSLSQLIMFIPSAVAVPLLTRAARIGPQEVSKDSYDVLLRINWFLALLISLGLGLYLKLIVPFIYGANFILAIDSIYIFSMASFFISLTNFIFEPILTGRGKVWQELIIKLLWGIVFLFFALILSKIFGVEGYIFSYLISYLVYLLIFMEYCRKNNILSGIHWSLVIYTTIIMLSGFIIQKFLYGLLFYFLSFGLIMTAIISGYRFILSTTTRASLNVFFRSFIKNTKI